MWCLSDAATQYSHVQYLSILIKENKKTFRLTFGVQYLLDVIKTFYRYDVISYMVNDCITCITDQQLASCMPCRCAEDFFAFFK